MVRLYTLLESEALSKDHPVHEYFEQREINLLKEYTFAAKRDGVARPGTHRTAGTVRYGRTAIALAQRSTRCRFRWGMEGHDRPSHSLIVLFSPISAGDHRNIPATELSQGSPCLTAASFLQY